MTVEKLQELHNCRSEASKGHLEHVCIDLTQNRTEFQEFMSIIDLTDEGVSKVEKRQNDRWATKMDSEEARTYSTDRMTSKKEEVKIPKIWEMEFYEGLRTLKLSKLPDLTHEIIRHQFKVSKSKIGTHYFWEVLTHGKVNEWLSMLVGARNTENQIRRKFPISEIIFKNVEESLSLMTEIGFIYSYNYWGRKRRVNFLRIPYEKGYVLCGVCRGNIVFCKCLDWQHRQNDILYIENEFRTNFSPNVMKFENLDSEAPEGTQKQLSCIKLNQDRLISKNAELKFKLHNSELERISLKNKVDSVYKMFEAVEVPNMEIMEIRHIHEIFRTFGPLLHISDELSYSQRQIAGKWIEVILDDIVKSGANLVKMTEMCILGCR